MFGGVHILRTWRRGNYQYGFLHESKEKDIADDFIVLLTGINADSFSVLIVDRGPLDEKIWTYQMPWNSRRVAGTH